MMVMAERLEEVERKRLIPQNQAGFRESMGTIDHIYTLNYIDNRQISREERREDGGDVC